MWKRNVKEKQLKGCEQPTRADFGTGHVLSSPPAAVPPLCPLGSNEEFNLNEPCLEEMQFSDT